MNNSEQNILKTTQKICENTKNSNVQISNIDPYSNSSNSISDSTATTENLFNQRKKFFANSSLNEEVKFKEFEELEISTKKDLKPLMDYFKNFAVSNFKEDSELKEFKISQHQLFNKRNSFDEYAFLKSNSSDYNNSSFLSKMRKNSILKALEIEFNRKSYAYGNC
jgi:hypothetical protein